ncbi:M50 family metallopeptidase [Actinomycetospora callitridis]|uniref:M50 family metallopeptidase n=1 Tax=Actinomycetospora callitridis TaxID=913944 RepID=UPI002365912C|nr:M50 family metallopeptidase [Actinomycetospora callitridis]MDD7917153.1 M50 family metallopeptidase [Actinomycetospora callitridis]
MVGVDLAVNDVPIVGEPIAFGVGFIVLLFVCFSAVLRKYFVTLAHEGGHVLVAAVTLRPKITMELKDNGNGETGWARSAWFPNVLNWIVGYATPPLLGLAAAALIAIGNPWAVLLGAVVLSFALIPFSIKGLAFLVPTLVVLGVGYVLVSGSAELQAGVAVGIAWLLLIGGAADNLKFRGGKADAGYLARATIIFPTFVWELLWAFVSIVTLIVGGQLLLRPGYAIG